jgi:hypothetical protein
MLFFISGICFPYEKEPHMRLFFADTAYYSSSVLFAHTSKISPTVARSLMPIFNENT